MKGDRLEGALVVRVFFLELRAGFGHFLVLHLFEGGPCLSGLAVAVHGGHVFGASFVPRVAAGFLQDFFTQGE